MTQFGGSLRFAQLPAVMQLLADLGSTGRLRVRSADRSGEIIIREGQIVAARLGAEEGRAALEAIALGLPEGEFNFVDEPVANDDEVLVAADARAAYMNRLGAEHQRIAWIIPSLKLVPHLVESPSEDSAQTQILIGAGAWQLIPSLVFGHTLEQVASRRGVARTLREVATLIEGGLVKLEPSPSAASERVLEKPAPAPVQPFSAAPLAHRVAPRPRAVPPPAVAARLAAASHLVVLPADSPSSEPPPRPAWRTAIINFFMSS